MKKLVVFLSSLAMLLLMPVTGQALPGGTEVSAATYDIVPEAAEGFSAEAGALSLGSSQGTFTSAVFSPGWEFIGVGVTWKAPLPVGVTPKLQVRVSQDGITWGEWTSLDIAGDDRPDHVLPTYTELLFLRGKHAQLRGSIQNPAKVPLRWQGLRLTLIDGGVGPTAQELSARTAATGGGPPVISRAAWGANESYRFSSNGNEIWPRQYYPLRALFVHHTYRPLPTYPDPAEAVRATYYYHAVTLGWGDIGYHYMIDQYGNIYQGRYGTEWNGQVVEAGHALGYNRNTMGISMIGDYTSALPNSAMLNSLEALLVDRAATYGIRPLEPVWLDGVGSISPDRWFSYSLLGHRDSHNPARTTCPGQKLWEYLPTLRTRVTERLGQETQFTLVTPGRDSVLSGITTIQVNASPNITRVEYFLDGSMIGANSAAPWSLQVDTASLPAGYWLLKAVGYTQSGMTVSAEYPVTIATAAARGAPSTGRQTLGGGGTLPGRPSAVRQEGVALAPSVEVAAPNAPSGGRCEALSVPNGSIDSNTSWLMTLGDYAARYVADERVWSAPRSLRVGMAPGDNYAGWSSARLPVTIPADATAAALTMHYLPQTENVYGTGRQAIGLLDEQGTYIQSLIPMGLYHESEWQSLSYDLSGFIGRTIYLYVGTENTGANPTRLYADDLQITICRP